MEKELTWEDIKEFLSKELDKTKHIMTFGTIGSLNINRDIDTIITKKPSSASSQFYKEVHNIFDQLESFLLKKYKIRIIRFSSMGQEILIKNYSKLKDPIMFHTMIYHSLPQLEKDWNWALFPEEKVKEVLDTYKCLKGKKEDLFDDEFSKSNYCDNLFTYLYLNDLIHSHLEEEVILESMNHLYDYLFRKRLKNETHNANNLKEIRKLFYEFCDLADRINKKHPQ